METPPRHPSGHAAGTPPRQVYSVSELAELLRGLLDSNLPLLWVQGELSNFSRPGSGHWYFTLKDARAQLRCAMFRSANLLVRPVPQDGDEVLVRGQIGIYVARGELQLVVEHMEPAGTGALLRAFEELKRRLAAEGLFEAARKRPIPAVPRAIGLVTSATGAAVHDVLTTLSRRFPLAPVHFYPVPVQGAAAAPAIVRALRELPRRAPVDVLLLVRGGGSLEDLWAFNEELVARAVRACAVPVICGIGHEIDSSIADFAADLRAPTPTAAAELATPNLADWRLRIEQARGALSRSMAQARRTMAERLSQLETRLERAHPRRRLQHNAQRLDELEARLQGSFDRRRRQACERLDGLGTRLRAGSPAGAIGRQGRQLDALLHALRTGIRARLAAAEQRRARADAVLIAVSPRAVLDRGYAILSDDAGRVVRSARGVQPGDALDVTLADGHIEVRAEQSHS